jgi:hypothetical protein
MQTHIQPWPGIVCEHGHVQYASERPRPGNLYLQFASVAVRHGTWFACCMPRTPYGSHSVSLQFAHAAVRHVIP